MPSTTDIQRTARRAGVLYLVLSIVAMFSFFYLRPRFVISGDAAATASNIVAHEQLYRTGILLDLVGQLVFIVVVLELYRLFKDVDRTQARLMLALVGTGIAVQVATQALNVAPLILLGGADYLSAFTRPQLEALAYESLTLFGKQGDLLTAFWGVWLFPFAYLTIKSGFLPKFLGVLLILSGVAYIVTCATAIVFPAAVATVTKVMMPFYFGEFIVVLWLAFVGAKPRVAEG